MLLHMSLDLTSMVDLSSVTTCLFIIGLFYSFYLAITEDNPFSEFFFASLIIVAVLAYYFLGVYWAVLLTILSGLILTYCLIWSLTKMMQWAIHH